MSHLRRLTVLLILLAAACASTEEEPVVATEGALEPERAAPAIGDGTDVPEPALLDPNRVVARVNDQTLTVRSLQSQFGPRLRTLDLEETSEEELRFILDQLTLRLIADRLFLEAAEKMGVTITSEEMARIRERYEQEAIERGTTLEEDLSARGIPMWVWEEEQRNSIIRDRYVYMALGRIQPMSPETRAQFDAFVRPVEVREFYERHPDEFRLKEEAKLAGIYVRDLAHDGDPERAKAHAISLVSRARRGEAFAKLVEEVHGDRPLALYDEPFDRKTAAEKFPEEVQEFAWTSPVGAISDPIRMPSGWLILKLERRQSARLVPFEEVREEIEQGLFNLKMNIGRLKLQLDLLEDAVVEPRRFKNAIREGLREEIRKNLDALHG